MPVLFALRGLAAAVTPEVHVFGTGPDVSYVIIQEKSLSVVPLIFAYRYTYASNPPMTGDGLLSLISASFPELQIQTTQYSFGKSLDAFDVQGRTVSSSTAPDGNSGTYWSYYVSGGYDGSGAVATSQWLYSQYGFDSRTIAPGSCDGWTFANWQGTNQPSDLPPSLDVTNIASLVAAAAVTPTPIPTPTPVPIADTNPMAISIGRGPDVSYVVIQESSLSSRPIVFAYHYTNASSPPINGYQLLLAIHDDYPDFDFATTQYSFGKSLDAFRFRGVTISASTAPDGGSGFYWSYYLCGGYDGSGAIGTNNWSYSQFGFESRTIAPGSCDGWTLASWQGTNGMDVPPAIDPTFLASLATGSGTVTGVTSASPTPSPSPKGASSTPQASSGGGALSGGISPVALPQSVTQGAAPSFVNATGPATRAATSDSPSGAGGGSTASGQESTPVMAVAGQGGYSAPAWLQASGFLAPVHVSKTTPRRSDPKSTGPFGSLKVLTPFEPEKLPIRNQAGLAASHDSGVGEGNLAERREGAATGFLQRMTGRISRFWNFLLQWLHLTPA